LEIVVKKVFSILLALALLLSLSACSADQRAARISEGWTEALLQVPGVVSARSHYSITPGMSQSGMVQITILPRDRNPEDVLADSMRALAPLIKKGKTSAGINYTLIVDGSDTLITPEILGLESMPSIQSILDYAAKSPGL
jgi:hypothetical protein